MSLPFVRGGAARSAAEGLYLTQTIFFFSVLQSLSFYNPSGAVAPAPFTQGSLFLFCANIVGNTLHTAGGASSLYRGTFWFVRTLREYILLLARATIGRPFCVNLNSVGGHSICPAVWDFILTTGGGSKPPYGEQSVNSKQREGSPLPEGAFARPANPQGRPMVTLAYGASELR